MTGPDTETLTAALRRLADEHASGLLSVATPGRDVVLELADGVPVGIGPPHDVSDRVGRDASAELVAAAVIDGLVDRTVAAIVGGGGAWEWDVSDSATMMPVPPELSTELSRRAVDAAQALATLEPDQVLVPARDLETHGEVDRIRDLFDGDRTLAEVADLADLTVPAAATIAAALVSAGVLSSGLQDTSPSSWTDAVAGSSSEDDDEDEPELWVMDPPDDDEVDEEVEEEVEEEDDRVDEAPAAPAAPAARDDVAEPTQRHTDPVTAEPELADVAPGPTNRATDDDWADTTWLDDLGASDRRGAAASGDEGAEESGDPRAALSAMITDLQGQGRSAPQPPDAPDPAATPATPPPTDRRSGPRDEGAADPEDPADQGASTEARRKEPKAAPGEVAEFLRELSRLALDDD